MTIITQRLDKLLQKMQEKKIQNYLISTLDEFLSEYSPKHLRRLEYVTGFTGSFAICVVKENHIDLFTNGIYLLQAKEQLGQNLDDSWSFDVYSLSEISEVMRDSIKGKIFYDPSIFSLQLLQFFPSQSLQKMDENLVDLISQRKQSHIYGDIYDYDIAFAGQTREEKIVQLRHEIIKYGKESGLFISDPHSVNWLLNIRGADLEYTPISLSFAFVDQECVIIFSDGKIKFDLPAIQVRSLEDIQSFIVNFKGKLLLDRKQATVKIVELVGQGLHQFINDPILLMKAQKNQIELNHTIAAHELDAVAVIETLSYIQSRTPNQLKRCSEYDLGKILAKNRESQFNYKSDSFGIICAFAENGAIIHYQPSKELCKKIDKSGLLLIDSGGQYLGATTDITRVINIGAPTSEQVKRYTQVLMGHIDLAMAKFPEDKITGRHLDMLARQYLWQDGVDYAHGTGHGVGSYLSVHEGPANISLYSNENIKESMVFSNEPGYYKENEYGIRIENLMFSKKCKQLSGFLEFQQLTLIPYCKAMIDFQELNSRQLRYLREYYQRIESRIAGKLSEPAQKWLRNEIDLA